MATTVPLHCITSLLVLMAVSSFSLTAADTEPKIATMETQSKSISPLVLELMNRMDEMERRHENEINILHRRIEALEKLHTSDLQHKSIQDKKITTLENRVQFLNDFVNKHIGEGGHQPLWDPKDSEEGHSTDAENGSSNNGSFIGSNMVNESTNKKGSAYNTHSEMKAHQGRITRVASSQVSGTGFHAILDNVLLNPGVGQSIAFRNVITNLGNGYSPNSGIFRCTQAGLYVFSSTLSLGQHEKDDAQIQRNGNTISAMTCGTDDHWSSCTATAVVELEEGDEVWVAMVFKHQAGTHLEANFSAFSGFLLPRMITVG